MVQNIIYFNMNNLIFNSNFVKKFVEDAVSTLKNKKNILSIRIYIHKAN